MGGAFSKAAKGPIEGSAREVLARRKAVEVIDVAEIALEKNASNLLRSAAGGITKPAHRQLGHENEEFSPAMIREMSNWGSMVKATSVQVCNLLP